MFCTSPLFKVHHLYRNQLNKSYWQIYLQVFDKYIHRVIPPPILKNNRRPKLHPSLENTCFFGSLRDNVSREPSVARSHANVDCHRSRWVARKTDIFFKHIVISLAFLQPCFKPNIHPILILTYLAWALAIRRDTQVTQWNLQNCNVAAQRHAWYIC